jgi:hypothetical protein
MQTCIAPSLPEAETLGVPTTNRPQRIYLPYRVGPYAPIGVGVLDRLDESAQNLSRTRQKASRPPRTARVKKMVSAVGRKARQVFERSGEVFD